MTKIKPIDTELTPETKEYLSYLEWLEKSMQEYITIAFRIPKKYLN